MVVSYREKTEKVSVIYFRRTGCSVVEKTDNIVQEIDGDLGIELEIITVDLTREEKLSEQEIILKNEYNVIGVPVIIINGKEYTGVFTKESIEGEICKKFLFRPEECK
ncbi:MAG: hypothetical protein GF368_02270 [Candidatus Aenigmarchaeota archaeon]|nr:hypothetical protein [Candidatus Aenigmarchaeota archaeon]